jgi:hypothetical protein
MKNKSVTTYHVTYEGMGGWFAHYGYSKYNERLTKKMREYLMKKFMDLYKL